MIQIQYSVEAALWGHGFIWAGVNYDKFFLWGMKPNKHTVHADTELSSDSETLPEDIAESVSVSIIFTFHNMYVCVGYVSV